MKRRASLPKEKSRSLCRRVLNISNVLGAIAFMALVAVPGAVDKESYITATVLFVTFAGCAYLSMKEDGQIK